MLVKYAEGRWGSERIVEAGAAGLIVAFLFSPGVVAAGFSNTTGTCTPPTARLIETAG